MKKIFLGLGAIIFLALEGRGYWAYQQVKNAGGPRGVVAEIPLSTIPEAVNIIPQATAPVDSETIAEQTTTTPLPDQVVPTNSLQLSITAKKTYQVNEYMTGIKYQADYNGPNFDAVVLYKRSYIIAPTNSTSGYVAVGVKGSINTYNLDFRTITKVGFVTSLAATSPTGSSMQINGKKTDVSTVNIFEQEGTYILSMSVYKCSDIVKSGKCSTDTVTVDQVLKQTPVKTVSQTVTVKGTAPVVLTKGKTVMECVGTTDPMCLQKYLDVFTENLKSCNPSSGTTPIGAEVFLGVFRKYEILGVQGAICAINFSLLTVPGAEAPIAALQGQLMTCTYKDSERTVTDVASAKNCTGPLSVSLANLKF